MREIARRQHGLEMTLTNGQPFETCGVLPHVTCVIRLDEGMFAPRCVGRAKEERNAAEKRTAGCRVMY